jgi:hypothetical protein
MVELAWLGGWNWNWDWLYGLSFGLVVGDRV